jgi:hypothetical protein
MLSGLGSLPGRGSMCDSGGGMRGCDLRPGPESCYLDGDNIQATAGKYVLGSEGGYGYTGGNAVVVLRLLSHGDAVACEWPRINPVWLAHPALTCSCTRPQLITLNWTGPVDG